MLERRIAKYIMADLNRGKMVFISGPRQCGKTTLSKSLPFSEQERVYYNWDIEDHRKRIKKSLIDDTKKLWIFDELHKFSKWRNWLKGIYDLHHSEHRIVVTGSARLDLYSRGGDSLQGRYLNYRLHPLTLGEILNTQDSDYRETLRNPSKIKYDHKIANDKLLDILKFGCFPEPFFAHSTSFSGRWRSQYGKRLVREDVRDLEQTKELDQMELLFERLPDLISNNLSINNLSDDLEVSHQTISKWLNIFTKLYACFFVLPWGHPKIKAVKKERKLYLWDWTGIEASGARLENLVALHLMRLVHWYEDVYGEKIDLRYFKDSEGHEVDFIIMKKNQPWIAIEVKSSEQDLNTGLKYFLNKVKVPFAYQIALKSDQQVRLPDINGAIIRAIPAAKFLFMLP